MNNGKSGQVKKIGKNSKTENKTWFRLQDQSVEEPRSQKLR